MRRERIGELGRRASGDEANSDAYALADVPIDGSASVTIRPSAKSASRKTSAGLEVTIDEGLTLRVRCVDDLTGREMPQVVVRGAVPEPSVDDGLPEGDGWTLAVVGPDQAATVAFAVDAPPGFVAWDPQCCRTTIGAWPRELEAVYPLRREADVRVSVLDHEGRPASGAGIDIFAIAGVSTMGATERLGPGVSRLRGVPFFRHVMLTVTVSTKQPYARAAKSVELPAHPSSRTELTIRLPPPSWVQRGGARSLIGMGGGAGGRFGSRGRSLRTGIAVIEVLRYDGSPASKARVEVGGRTARTNDAGTARIEGLRVGEQDVVVHAHGLLPLSGFVYVAADREVRLVLREPEGGAIDVYVTDAWGDPLPFAAIQVQTPTQTAWVDERDGRQRVDTFTDHWGHRRVERVEAGRISIRAAWGGLEAEVPVDVREGRGARATLVLRSPGTESSEPGEG